MAWDTEILNKAEKTTQKTSSPATLPAQEEQMADKGVSESAQRSDRITPNVGYDIIVQDEDTLSQGDRDAGPDGIIRTVQTKLNALGLDVGDVDGVIGRKTSGTIQEAQGMLGLPRTGLLDKKTRLGLITLSPNQINFFKNNPISEAGYQNLGENVPVTAEAAKRRENLIKLQNDNQDQYEEASGRQTPSSFFLDIGIHGESDHGGVPKVTNDAKEKDLPVSERTRDIGFGHKITAAENASGFIHGVRFKKEDGTFRELTKEDKTTILMADMGYHKDRARVSGWDTKLANIGSSWDTLGEPYRNALTSLAYNVGGDKAGKTWTNVLTAARDKNVQSFALGLRRKDAGQHTAGMDNRVVKELYYSGLISSLSEVANQLPLANAAQAGIPE